jgi:hypothetical protein
MSDRFDYVFKYLDTLKGTQTLPVSSLPTRPIVNIEQVHQADQVQQTAAATTAAASDDHYRYQHSPEASLQPVCR